MQAQDDSQSGSALPGLQTWGNIADLLQAVLVGGHQPSKLLWLLAI